MLSWAIQPAVANIGRAKQKPSPTFDFGQHRHNSPFQRWSLPLEFGIPSGTDVVICDAIRLCPDVDLLTSSVVVCVYER
jgi:hypothetical protein